MKTQRSGAGYRIVALSRARRVMASLLEAARTRRLLLAFTEAEISGPREELRAHRAASGEALSFTAYVAASLARAVVRHPSLNAARRGRNLVVFDDVNIACYLENRRDGEPVVEFRTLQRADRASVPELTTQLRAHDTHAAPVPRALRHVPVALLPLLIRRLARNPAFLARSGVIAISNVGAESNGAAGWGFAPSATTVEVTIGGISTRPVFVDGELREREFVCLTVSLDHDIVDGAVAARFVRTFVDLVASGAALDELRDAARSSA